MDERPPPTAWASASQTAYIQREYPSYRDFVDDALFHPAWGYYGSGKVRFGDGAHFDTFPLALSPCFGRMLAEYAHRLWLREGAPRQFELCEIGGGNGQLCADCLIWIWQRARHEHSWKRFAAGFRYRIIERSPALADRQRRLLGPLAESVRWTNADLTAARRRAKPLAEVGLVFANEVLDCQAHHKVVASEHGPGVVYVAARAGGRGAHKRSAPLRRSQLGGVLGDERTRRRVSFEEVLVPLRTVPGLEPFLRRHHAELFAGERPGSSTFACPNFEPLIRNAGQLHARGEVLWIDYGEERAFHRASAPDRRVFAGRPGCRHSIYDAPGREDISFLVDFTVVAEAVRRAGFTIDFYGHQGELARRSGVRLDRRAVDLMVRTRALGWMLAVMGVGPEQWKSGAVGWGSPTESETAVRDYVRRSTAEFLGRAATQFKLMIMRVGPRSIVTAKRGSPNPRGARARRSSRAAGP
jgi:SAM-dependent MidA family methyltransferase